MAFANNKGVDQPAQSDQRLSFRWLDSIMPILAKSKISRLYLAPEVEQAGLCLIWSQTPKDRFSRDVAPI